ncbi:MAG: hypothetical protein NTY13_02400 [Chlamydiae bacterium]|nr:hypothetical protein [Chlamydiota bacterium]
MAVLMCSDLLSLVPDNKSIMNHNPFVTGSNPATAIPTPYPPPSHM